MYKLQPDSVTVLLWHSIWVSWIIYDTLLWCVYEFWFHCSGFFLKPLIRLSPTSDFLAEFLCLTQKGNNFDQQKNLEDQLNQISAGPVDQSPFNP